MSDDWLMSLSATYPLVRKDTAVVADFDLESFIEQYYPRILRSALVMTGNAAEAEDLTQETFLQAMRGLNRFDGRSRLETWVYSILLNQHRRRLRTKERSWRRRLRWFHQKTKKQEPSPVTPLLESELKETLWSRVAELPEPQKQAVLLRYAEGFTYEEIASLLDCPIGTVKSRLHNGLTVLRRKMTAREINTPAQNTQSVEDSR